MKTVMTKSISETSLLIQGIKGKLDDKGNVIHTETTNRLNSFIKAFDVLISQ